MTATYILTLSFVVYSIWERRTKAGKEFLKEYEEFKKNKVR